MSLNNELISQTLEPKQNGRGPHVHHHLSGGLPIPEHDGLTGLFTHAAFQEQVADLFARANSDKKILACLMLDIDHFHAINHRFGYAFGEMVLLQVAQTLREISNSQILLSRFAGEQFSVAWITESSQSAIQFAEKIRVEIANHKFTALGKSTYVTVSIGLALSDAKTKSVSELLASSQLVLRTAKREGRNRVCYWEQQALASGVAQGSDLLDELQKKFASLERDVKAFGTSEVLSLLDEFEIPDGLPEDHAENVAFIAASIADEIGMSERQIDVIISAALL
ncbi:MAG: diguanylate cyclase, partial [Calditrichaeota bacterium]